MQGSDTEVPENSTPCTCQRVNLVLPDVLQSSPAWIFAFYKYRMYAALFLNKHVSWNIQTLFFKTAYLANYRVKYVLSTQNLIAPVGSLVFIQWHCSVLCPFCIMEAWTEVNSGHLPVSGNAVHCPGIMGIFPTCSGKMSPDVTSFSTASET